MSLGDQIKNAAEDALGRVKQAVGRATDNHDLQVEGVAEQEDARAIQEAEQRIEHPGPDDDADGSVLSR